MALLDNFSKSALMRDPSPDMQKSCTLTDEAGLCWSRRYEAERAVGMRPPVIRPQLETSALQSESGKNKISQL